MKAMKKFFETTIILFLTLIMFSCSNPFETTLKETKSNAKTKAAFITLSLDGYNSRTVLPETDQALFTDLVLKGTKSGGIEEELGAWDSVTEMQDATIPVSTGSWTFELSAKQGGTTLSGTVQKNIKIGDNELFF